MRPAKISSVIALVFAAGIVLTARPVQSQPLYGATSQFGVCPSNLYSIDPATGAATLIGPTVGPGSVPYCLVSAMKFDRSNGVLYAIGTTSQGGASGVLMAIDTKTAAVTEIGDAGIFGTDMAFRSDGTLYVHGGSELDPVAHNIFIVDTATAAATFLGITGFLGPGNGLAFSPGDVLYHASGNSLNTINQSTGAATHVATLSFPAPCTSGNRRINAMDFRPGSGTLYGVLNCDNAAWHLVTINTGTGAVTNVGPTGVAQMDALAFQPDGYSPARLWVGLKNSDDVGLRLDLKAELFLDTTSNPPIASGEVDNVQSGSSGFNNAQLNSVFLNLAGGPTGIVPAGNFLLRVSVRRTCSGGGHASGTARLWYNGRAIDTGSTRDAGSRFDVTQGGVNSEEYLRTGFALSDTAGSSRTFIDKAVDSKTPCPSRPFVPFGTWTAP
jgi:hypothetical protein